MTMTVKERFETKVIKTDGCWEWGAGKDRAGYGQFKFAKRTQRAHRIAYQLYVGAIPDGLCILHRCDNPACCRPDHLFLGTDADNVHDCENKGRRASRYGEKNTQSKLSECQVIEIRTRQSAGERGVDLARIFGVSKQTISAIVRRSSWEWLCMDCAKAAKEAAAAAQQEATDGE